MREAGRRIVLPRLYCIVDPGCFAAAPDPTSALVEYVRELIAGGAMLVQYRNKLGTLREMLSQAREIRRVIDRSSLVVGEEAAGHSGRGPTANGVQADQRPTTNDQRPLLVMNDRADLCLAAGFDGVHVGQDDLSPEAARRVVGAGRLVGVSTHNLAQVHAADAIDCDYIAVGPVFATASKHNPDPVIGLEGVRAARAATSKPLVAIGGITRANCAQVIAAGADSCAVIGDLLKDPRTAVEQFDALFACSLRQQGSPDEL